uniref:Ceramide kinase n=1 Tax=Gasterosteus aculeatus aculeatus TaxID=481459 RepID=A0AAQ4QJS4_GASAC
MDQQARLLSSQLVHKRRQVEVALTCGVLAWREIERSARRSCGFLNNGPKTASSHAVQVGEIVAVLKTKNADEDYAETGRSPKKAKHHSPLYPFAFTVSYIRRRRQHQWRCRDVTFHSANEGLCDQWIQVINEQLSLLITERVNHARDHLNTEANLDKYDGIVCVGGDGMFSEILHGLVTRIQTDNGVDQNQQDVKLLPCGLRIGIIPAGSTDCICFATVGTNDPVTSALHVIVGDSQPMDVCSVHHDDVFLRYSVSLLGYGFYGDVLTDSQKKRYLGPARYDLSGVKTFLSHNYYEGTISFLLAENNIGDPRDKLQCRSGCHVCQHKPSSKDVQWEMSQETSDKDGRVGWSVIRGKFIAINAASMSCACPRSPKGLSPSAHLADGTTDLILVRKCSRLDFLRHLVRHTNKEDQFDHSFVEVHRVRRFCFQPQRHEVVSLEDPIESPKKTGFRPVCSAQTTCDYGTSCSSWNCDGEILPRAAIQVSVHCQLIRLFARGIEQQPPCLLEDQCTLAALEPSRRRSVD